MGTIPIPFFLPISWTPLFKTNYFFIGLSAWFTCFHKFRIKAFVLHICIIAYGYFDFFVLKRITARKKQDNFFQWYHTDLWIQKRIESSLCSSLFRFLSGKRESREGSGTEVTKKSVAGGGAGKERKSLFLSSPPPPPVPRFAPTPCVRATSLGIGFSPS